MAHLLLLLDNFVLYGTKLMRTQKSLLFSFRIIKNTEMENNHVRLVEENYWKTVE